MEASYATARLADIVLVAHGFIAAFITAGFFVIPLGAGCGWRFVRWYGLRLAHLFGTLFVAVETVLGFACPLTIWEGVLRNDRVDDAGFIARWAHSILYYDVPLLVFSVIYVVAAALALLLWVWIPPARRAQARRRQPA